MIAVTGASAMPRCSRSAAQAGNAIDGHRIGGGDADGDAPGLGDNLQILERKLDAFARRHAIEDVVGAGERRRRRRGDFG